MKSVQRKTGGAEKIKQAHRILVGCALSLLVLTAPLHAQESGPMLMKQELGYTLGGGVVGAGFGVILWFMDPLNPDRELKDSVKDGFVSGVILGSLFGFYLLQNAAQFPLQGDALPSVPLGLERKPPPGLNASRNIRIPLFSLKF